MSTQQQHIPNDPLEDREAPIPPETPVRRHDSDDPSASDAGRTAVRARWAAETEVTDDLRCMFTEIDMAEGLSLLARMRQNCELAARTLEARRTAETDATACKMCKRTAKEFGGRWRMIRPRRDLSTGTLYTDYFCSDACIVEENRMKHGIAAMTDRGMANTKESLAARAKTSIEQHQEKIRQDTVLRDWAEKETKRENKRRQKEEEDDKD